MTAQADPECNRNEPEELGKNRERYARVAQYKNRFEPGGSRSIARSVTAGRHDKRDKQTYPCILNFPKATERWLSFVGVPAMWIVSSKGPRGDSND